MKFTFLCLLLLSLFSSLPIDAQVDRSAGVKVVSKLPSIEKRFALIIGVDAYQKDISPLYGTVNDAKALHDVLIKHAGFTDERIILMTTDSNDSDLIPTRGNIIDQLDKLSRVVPEDGLILFSFSGHGVSIGNDAFIVPSDGRIYQNVDLMRERALDVLRIKQAIQATKVKQVIMFLDACRNDPVRAKGEADNDLTAAYAKGFSFDTKNQNIEAYATLYATSFGDRAYEFLDRKTRQYRGYFSYAIEEGLKGAAADEKGEITLGGLIDYIEARVKERVRINENQRQIPYPATEGFRNSDLVIAVVEKNTPAITNPNLGEATFWNAIENSNNISDFESYLKHIERGEFKGIYKSTAELKIIKLKKANIAGAWTRFRPVAKLLLKYDVVGSLSEDLTWVGLNNKWGFINKIGKEVIPLKYDSIDSFSDGLALVELNKKFFFVNKKGETVFSQIYKEAHPFSEGLSAVLFENKTEYDYINKLGKVSIPTKYQSASSFSEGMAIVGMFDFTGETTPDGKGSYIEWHYGFINKTGQLVTEIEYNAAIDFSEELAGVALNQKSGFIDKTGKVVIPLKYDSVGSFSNGLASVRLNDRWGFINKANSVVIPLKYDSVGSFFNGLAVVVLNGKKGLIDKTGKEIIPLKYEKVWCWTFYDEGFIGFILNGKKGFVDIYGNEYFDF